METAETFLILDNDKQDCETFTKFLQTFSLDLTIYDGGFVKEGAILYIILSSKELALEMVHYFMDEVKNNNLDEVYCSMRTKTKIYGIIHAQSINTIVWYQELLDKYTNLIDSRLEKMWLEY